MVYNENRFMKPEPSGQARLKVADVLANYGIDVGLLRNGLIKSPFRDERTASFHILPNGYAWKDFGDGSGGGVIDLVMRLDGCSRDGAIRRLAEMRGGRMAYVPRMEYRPPKSRTSVPGFKVVSSSPFTNPTLTFYAQERGISEEVLKAYCTEVAVRIHRGTRLHSYIGFRNSADGYVLRNERPGKDGKRCTSAAPSFMSSSGEHTAGASSERVAVFEGLFDFLSYIERKKGQGVEPGCDVCVLNSVTNLPKALPFILGHRVIDLYLDNDSAGRRASQDIASAAPGAVVTDHSGEYARFNDFNDFHVNDFFK